MTISRLLIRNFQLHSKLDLQLDEKITTIIGPSDSGKSSIIRALRWVSLNKPRGEAFVQEGAKSVLVKVKVDGKTIERSRKGNENKYKVNEQKYKAFGADIPDAVQSLLNLGDVNFANQHDAPYWFTLSPPEVARQLNQIVDLGLIDEVVGRIASRLRKGRVEMEVVEGRLTEAKERADQLAYVPKLVSDLEEVEGLSKESTLKSNTRDHLDDLVGQAVEYIQTRERALKRLSGAQRVLALGKVAKTRSDRAGGLSGLLTLTRAADTAASRPIPNLGGVGEKGKEASDLRIRWKEMLGLVSKIRMTKVEIEERYNRVGKAKDRLQNESGGLCPLCGQEWEV